MTTKQDILDTPIKEYFVVARVNDHQVVTNVPRRVVKHSPDGFEFGYEGSGPSDLALNLAIEVAKQLHLDDCGEPVERDIPRVASLTYHALKRRFIAGIPDQGARIPMMDIKKWMYKASEQLRESGDLPQEIRTTEPDDKN